MVDKIILMKQTKINILNPFAPKLNLLIFLSFLFSGILFGQTGVVNRGARIVVNTGAHMRITGGAAGSFTNYTNGSNHGNLLVNGQILLEGNWTNNATNPQLALDGTGTVRFQSSQQQFIAGANPTQFHHLTMSNPQGIAQNAHTMVEGTLNLASGRYYTQNHHLTLGVFATITGSFSANNMIVATGNGEVRKRYSTSESFLFPLGSHDGTARFSPALINFTSGTYSPTAYLGLSVKGQKHPANSSPNHFLNRYWIVNNSGITNFSSEVAFTYVDADIVGTESNIVGLKYSGTGWDILGPVNTASNQIASVVSAFSDFTGGESALGPYITIASSETINEGEENGKQILVTLHNDQFVASLNAANWTLLNAPAGITRGSVTRTGNTTATVTLSGNRTVDYDENITNVGIRIAHHELANLSSGNVEASTGVTFVAKIETVTISHSGLTRDNLNGAQISLVLGDETFNTTAPSTSQFVLNNAPAGTTVQQVNYINNTSVNVVLAYDNTPFTVDIPDFNITVQPAVLTGVASVTSNNLPISSVSTGISDPNGNAGIDIYFANGKIFIETSQPELLDVVEMFGLNGTKIMHKKLDKLPVNSIHANYETGIYIISVSFGKQTLTKRLMIFNR
jgi:hypothetical protein